MGRIKDRTGERYERLYVIENTGRRTDKGNYPIWKCKCDCGNFIEVSSKDFTIDKKRNKPRVSSCGCLNDEVRSSKLKFPTPCKGSKIEILEEIGYSSKRKIHYKCRCSCGEEIICDRKSASRRIQCDKCSRKKMRNLAHKRVGVESPLWRGHGSIPKTIYTLCKHGAMRRNIDFKIDIEFMDKLWNEQNGICALSGIKLKISTRVTDGINTTASLDRIDSSKGYIEGNVQWVHKDINKIKWGLSTETFIKYCRKVVEHADSK